MTNTLPDGKAGASLLPGTQVGEYIIDAKLGEGGFGAVYRASHPLIGKVVAIKVLSRALSSDPEMVSRFVAEARAVNQIRHRNIVDIFAFGQLPDERSYYVMAMLEGESLADRLGRGPLEVPQAITVLDAIGRALDAAHAAGIVHRDLKPDNIFLARDGDGVEHPTLLDFGIAKLLGDSKGGAMHKTRTGAPIGTPHYMSPEQCRGRDVDHRTDVYSLGVVAYQCLVGAVPFDGEDYMEILIKQMNDAAPAPSAHRAGLGGEVDRVVHWMMAKDPAARPQAIGPAIDALAAAARGLGHAVTLAPRRAEGARTTGAGGPASTSPSSPRAIGNLATLPTPAPPTGPDRGTPLGLDATMAGTPSSPGGGQAVPSIATIAAAPRGARARRLPVLLSVAALGAGVVGVVVWRGGGVARRAPAGAATSRSGSGSGVGSGVAPRLPAIVVDAAPAAPRLVTLTFEGAPPGAEVRAGDGRALGVVPLIQLPRSAEPTVLQVFAAGYAAVSLAVTPDADQTVPVPTMMAQEPRPGKAGGKGKGKGGKGKGGSASYEDPDKIFGGG
jgi:hypothetical protein